MKTVPSLSTIRTRLRLRHLQLVLTLSERTSLGRTANELAMTQPAATKALQEVEDLLGLPLFIRHSRGMQATEFGEAVIRYARVVFADLHELREELVAIQAGNVGKVRIGAVMAPAPDLLTSAIIALKERHPKLHLTVQIETSDVLMSALEKDEIDLFIGRIPDGWQAHELSFESMSEESLSVVVRPKHPATLKRQPKLAMLAEFPWIVQPHPSPMRQIIDQTFRETRIAPPVSRVETSSILTTLSLLLKSDMLAVLPTAVARYYQDLKMITVLPTPLRGQLAPYGLVYRKNRRVTSATQLVIDALRTAARQAE